jgi:hypothetical protein
VRAAVERVFVDALAAAATAGIATAALPDPAPMEAHGRLTAATVAGAAARALAEVVMPAARVLFRRERG